MIDVEEAIGLAFECFPGGLFFCLFIKIYTFWQMNFNLPNGVIFLVNLRHLPNGVILNFEKFLKRKKQAQEKPAITLGNAKNRSTTAV